MSAYVIDASAIVLALADKSEAAEKLHSRLPGMRLHAPHLIDAEAGNVLRRHESAGLLEHAEAHAAVRAIRALVDHRYPHAGELAETAWTLRHNLSFYDALYVALAARLGIALLTGDTRLSRAPRLPCRVELV